MKVMPDGDIKLLYQGKIYMSLYRHYIEMLCQSAKFYDYNDDHWVMNPSDERVLGLFAYRYMDTDPLKKLEYPNDRTLFQSDSVKLPIKVVCVNFGALGKHCEGGSTQQRRPSVSDLALSKSQVAENSVYLPVVDESRYRPTAFVMECDYWDRKSDKKRLRNSRQTLFTKDYLIVKHGPLLAYARLKEIWKKNIAVYRQLKKNQTLTELFSEGKFGWQDLKIDFNLLNIDALSA